MESNIKQVNISAYQVVFILLICRYQSFMISIKLREFLDNNNLNIFISIFISLASVFLIYIPAFILLKKFKYLNIIDISRKIFPKGGHVLSVIFSVYFLLMAMTHIISTNLFMISYVYIHAYSFLVIGIILVAIYAIYLGVESIFRSGAIIFVCFFILNILIFVLLIPTYNVNYFGPLVLSDWHTILNNSSMLTFNAELVAILILAEYTKEKTFLAYSSYQIILCIMEILLVISVTLSMGRYVDTNTFPLYTVTSMVEIPTLERLESFYIVLDTMLSVIKTSIYLFLSRRCLDGFIKKQTLHMPLVIFFGAICLVAAVFMVFNITILKILLSFINSSVVSLFFIVVIPVVLLIADKMKRSDKLTILKKF